MGNYSRPTVQVCHGDAKSGGVAFGRARPSTSIARIVASPSRCVYRVCGGRAANERGVCMAERSRGAVEKQIIAFTCHQHSPAIMVMMGLCRYACMT